MPAVLIVSYYIHIFGLFSIIFQQLASKKEKRILNLVGMQDRFTLNTGLDQNNT